VLGGTEKEIPCKWISWKSRNNNGKMITEWILHLLW
jgi:hypothetical protein